MREVLSKSLTLRGYINYEFAVLALPALLRELKGRGYRIVHVVSSTADRQKTVTEPEQWRIADAREKAVAARVVAGAR